MSTPRVTKAVISGHMTHSRTRLEKSKGARPGRIFVEVLVYSGKEATGEPVAEWEMPHVYRYDHDAAARQAVAQTRFPAADADTPGVWVFPPTADEAEQWPKESFVITREKRDGSFERLSGRDFSGKLDALEGAIANRLDDQAIWLKIHRDEVGTEVTPSSRTMSMLFTVGKITGVERTKVTHVIEEKVPEEGP